MALSQSVNLSHDHFYPKPLKEWVNQRSKTENDLLFGASMNDQPVFQLGRDFQLIGLTKRPTKSILLSLMQLDGMSIYVPFSQLSHHSSDQL